MKATTSDQRALLDLADLDAAIRQAEHARANPPQAARVQELIAQRRELAHGLTELQGARDDLRAELARIEADVAVVDARRARDEERLQVASNPKDIQGLQSELASLARRKSDLEDGELEVMEKVETAEQSVAQREAEVAEINAEGARLSADAKQIVAEASARIDSAQRDRSAVAASLPDDLTAFYERIASRGPGAARLRRRVCEGCHMELSGTDLHDLREVPEDEIATCPSCGTILVRTEESGL